MNEIILVYVVSSTLTVLLCLAGKNTGVLINGLVRTAIVSATLCYLTLIQFFPPVLNKKHKSNKKDRSSQPRYLLVIRSCLSPFIRAVLFSLSIETHPRDKTLFVPGK